MSIQRKCDIMYGCAIGFFLGLMVTAIVITEVF